MKKLFVTLAVAAVAFSNLTAGDMGKEMEGDTKMLDKQMVESYPVEPPCDWKNKVAIGAHGFYFWGQEDFEDFFNDNEGFGAGATLTWHFNNYVGVQLGYDWIEFGGFQDEVVDENSNGGGSESADDLDSVNAHAVNLSLLFQYPLMNCKLIPYVLGGVGGHFFDNNEDEEDGNNGHIGSGISFHAGAGVQYMLTKKWGVFTEGRYTWGSTYIKETQVEELEDVDFDYVTARVGVKYYFGN